MSEEIPFLSIVFPAYNEALRLPDTLEKTLAFVNSQSYSIEIVIAENGSDDDTLSVAQQFAAQTDIVNVLHLNQAGKGRAVQAGTCDC